MHYLRLRLIKTKRCVHRLNWPFMPSSTWDDAIQCHILLCMRCSAQWQQQQQQQQRRHRQYQPASCGIFCRRGLLPSAVLLHAMLLQE